MADSDDDFDRQSSRDKFRHERNDYPDKRSSDYEDSRGNRAVSWSSSSGPGRYSGRGTSPSRKRDSFGRDLRPNSYGGRSTSYNSYDNPLKRSRNFYRDLDDNGRLFERPPAYNDLRHRLSGERRYWDQSNDREAEEAASQETEELTQPLFLSFKQFTAILDDGVDHIDAAKQYNDYKIHYKQTVLRQFFQAHQNEEWFRLKYHPEDSSPRKAQLSEFLHKRKQVFFDFLNNGKLNNFRMQVDLSNEIIKLLDAFVILLEGGTEQDLAVLNMSSEELENLIKSQNGSSLPQSEDGGEMETDSEVSSHGPRPLHKTSSIFIRQLPPDVTREEVEALFKCYPQYLRLALADPQVDKTSMLRKGWVTFARNADIKSIYLSLNNAKIRDLEIGAIVNKDLSKRIRAVNGITGHKEVMQADLKLAVKLILALDDRRAMWPADSDSTIRLFGYNSANPLLREAMDFLIEEAPAEEEELLAGTLVEERDSITFEKNEELARVFDLLILYLRVVHSFDFYFSFEYPNEDEMPNRLGILHVRAAAPTTQLTAKQVDEYCETFAVKVNAYLEQLQPLEDKVAEQLGKKSLDEEVELFIQDNTQELGKDKWLCPLSGKKFKGPDFVRKHIENKHPEKLDRVREQASYFNNYVLDPRRPSLPEHPMNKAAEKQKEEANKVKKAKQEAENGDQSGNPFQPMKKSGRTIVAYNDLDDSLTMI